MGLMMRIGELATATGESVKTLRYWEGEDLLIAERAASRYRHFDPGSVARVAFIREAQALGFTLAEIRSILGLRDEGVRPCEEVRQQLREHLTTVRERLEQLATLEAELGARLSWAERHPEPDCEEGCVYLGSPRLT